MKLPHLLLAIIVSVTATLGTLYATGGLRQNNISQTTKETAFDRITRTNTLRCGYALATPWFMADPNTKQLSGVGYDVTNAIAKQIGVKVDWVEETGWGIAEQGLMTGRYDMLCASVCIDPRRARAATYSTPFLHAPNFAIVRADDKRFEAGFKAINGKNVRIGVKTGENSEFIADERFPLAQKVYASDLTDETEFYQLLVNNKIDVAFSQQAMIDRYNEKNPEKPVRPIPELARMCDGAFMLPLGDERLKNLVDSAIMEINSSGYLEEMIGRYVKLDPRYVRIPALAYRDK